MTKLTRRRLLGGAIALPTLESLLPRGARAALPPRRFIALFSPNSFTPEDWWPVGDGPTYETPPLLAPAERVKRKLLLLRGIENKPGHISGNGEHVSGTASMLTCRRVLRPGDGSNFRNGISVDQAIANVIGKDTRLPSLQLGLRENRKVGICDVSFACVYVNHISWAGEKAPLKNIVSPQLVFDRLFEGATATTSSPESERRSKLRKSILDAVRAEANALNPRLGTSDRAKLGEYLEGVRDVEKRIAAAPVSASCAGGTRPTDPDIMDLPARSRLMNDLIVLALRCDATRVVTHMLSHAFVDDRYPFIGVKVSHHAVSHYSGEQELKPNYRKICHWHMGEAADLLLKLDAVVEADGRTLLDNTMFFLSTDVADPNTHSWKDKPILIAGGGWAFKIGRYLRYPTQQSQSNLFVSVLNAFGIPATTFGEDCTGPLAGLT